MKRLLITLIAAAAPTFAAAFPMEMPSRPAGPGATLLNHFRAPRLVPSDAVALAAPQEKLAVANEDEPGGRIRVGTVRPLAKSSRVEQWVPIQGGFVAKLRVSSEDALGLRVKLELGDLRSPVEVRAQGQDGSIESMVVDPAFGSEAWTPWTEGAVQVIEVFSPFLPPADSIGVAAVLHFTASPFAKAAGTCTVSTQCASSDPALGGLVASAIAERKKSVAKLSFIDGGGGFVCTGTLINTDKFPSAYMLTANHCIDNASAALSLTTHWFHESTACEGAIPGAGTVQVAGGAQLVLTNQNVDSTLMLLNRTPPSGALFSGWNAARVSSGTSIVSISHPSGDTSRYAIGSVTQEYRIVDRPQDMYGVRFSKGIIEGGSSGSGLFTMAGGTLQLRGILTGTTVRQAGGMSCTNPNEEALYSRFEIFHPQIAQYISNAAQAADDAPNRPQDFATLAAPDAPLNTRADTLAIDNRRIDYAGDIDLYRFTLSAAAYVSAWTEGANLDTVGSILDSRGVSLESVDDAQAGDNHAGITRKLNPGTYYFQVTHWEAAGTGAYNVRMRADALGSNYTDLWWNPAESGWGINVNQQGNTVFATLFTYDASGAPLWLVMSQGLRQDDGSYEGTLYRSTGPAFNATSFLRANVTAVGTMRLVFMLPDQATLSYSFDGTQVTKTITRQVFATPPTCTWSVFDRSHAENYQDLWWNPAEPGWGVNITHQASTVFATLFTYETNNEGVWLVMSNGAGTAEGRFSGPLYKTRGPAFNASPWTPAVPTQVGTMSLAFSNGNAGTMTYSFNGVTVTKAIQRQVFAPLKTQCED